MTGIASEIVIALALCGLVSATEHHGIVKFGRLAVPGATVTATDGTRQFTTITDEQGVYNFPDLPDGTWTIQVEMPGFASAQREIGVGVGAPVPEWDLKLLPFSQMKTVAAPSAAPAVQTPEIASVQPEKKRKKKGEAEPVPANTGSGFQHAELKASVEVAPVESEPTAPPEELDQKPADGFLINGSVNNGAASPFAQMTAFGNNRFRRSLYNGSVGITFGDSIWDARSFSLTGQDTPKPSYTHTQGMLSFGGPLRIPRLFSRGPDVTVNYQWVRNRNASVYTGLVPTPAQRGGDFSQPADMSGKPIVPIDPKSGQPFPGKVIPQDRISPQAAALLGFYPEPNFEAGARYNYQVPLVGSSHQDALQWRLKKTIGRNSIIGQFAMQSARSDGSNLFGFLDASEMLGINTSVNWMRRFGSRLFVTLGYEFSRQSNRMTPYFADRYNVSGMAGIRGNNQEAANWGPPSLTFASGIATLSDVQNSFTRDQTSGVSASLYSAHGSHNITLGADFRRQHFNLLSQQDPRGSFAFTGAAAGSDFAGFLLGIPDASSIAFGNADKYLRASSYGSYFNDDWRVGASLTINAGLRWEYNSPITERYGRLVNLDTGQSFATARPVVAASAGRPLLDPYRHAFQPRVGISWRPLLASSLVIRAGYGVYYDTSIYLPVVTRMAQQSPLSTSLKVGNSAASPLTLANGFKAAPNAATNTFAVDPNFRPGYAQTWQISVQRDLPGSMVILLTYLGTKGTHGQQQFLPNTYPTGAANPCPACTAGYIYLTSNGNSARESGQIQLRRRLRSGFAVQFGYTFSKSIDDAAVGGRGQAEAVIAQDWLNLAGDRGLSDFDQRHVATVEVQYTTGMGLRGGTLLDGWQGRVFKDWTFATQVNGASGLPLTPIYFAAVDGTGVTGSIRPNYTGSSIYDAPPGLFLNSAAVTAPAAGQWGNAGRNSITGPAQFSLNALLARTFRLSERLSADFRLDAVNPLNRVVFTGWNAMVTSPQFGSPTAANPMRSLKANVRVRF